MAYLKQNWIDNPCRVMKRINVVFRVLIPTVMETQSGAEGRVIV